MAELNEKQLMLLDTLIYLNCGFPEKMSLESIVNDINLDGLRYDEGLTRENVEELLETIKKDEELMSLTVAKSVEGELGAACFVNPEGEAVIIYRGTGPAYVEWDDDVQGGYLADTDIQKQALAFAQECAENYDNITVSGHSKGGNMAQYVTVVMGDEIDRCVSFDGQGFSDEFLKKYADEISANQSKIRNVCAYNDYVNVLLTSLAGETVYLDNEAEGKGGHYLFSLYTNRNNQLNENGEFTTSREQASYIKTLNGIESVLVKLLDSKTPFSEFIIYTVIGSALGMMLGGDRNTVNIIKEIMDNLEDYNEYQIEKMLAGKKQIDIHVCVDTNALREFSGEMLSASGDIEELRARIQRLRKSMASNVISGISIGLPLQTVLMQLDSECDKLRKLAVVLNSSAEQYESAELRAKDMAI